MSGEIIAVKMQKVLCTYSKCKIQLSKYLSQHILNDKKAETRLLISFSSMSSTMVHL